MNESDEGRQPLVGADPDDVAALSGEVAELRELLSAVTDELTQQISELAASGTTAGASGEGMQVSPESWLDVSIARAPKYIAEVVEWAQTVGPHLSPPLLLQPCWMQHSSVVQAIADARAMWRWLYRSELARPYEAIDWTLRHWPDLHKKILSAMEGCKTNEAHQEKTYLHVSKWTIADVKPEAYERDAQEFAARGNRPANEDE
ncbi:hypothetical protein [Natronoglycomyces albus]|uniref:DUF4913 domain-containing protein n=1 Tax=Natronoglycomyces albus TaxID=2811108 RepID=A0A895XP90_9ACTN|nr:hypothetical protein [Natronoglycomyces albus]QSB07174.1 hypothetical protein JQS30_17175 [Natronoglycomyces albus]